MGLRHVVFDFDGTLVSSMEAVFIGLQKVFSEHLNRPISRQELERVFHHEPKVMCERLGVVEPQIQSQLFERWREITAAGKVEYSFFEHVDHMLDELKQKGFQSYIWTARDKHSTLEILESVGRPDFFVDLRSATCCEVKPNPEGLKQMLGDVPKDDVIMIGDSFTDVYGARNFGCSSIAAGWCPMVKMETLQELGATYIATNPLECLQLILKHFT